MNSIEIKNLSKSYGKFSLKDISFSLPTGTIMGLVGENGAGKSTIIKLIMNAIKAESGEISVLGVSNQSEEFLDIKQDIGIVLDEPSYHDILNAKEISKIMALTFKNWNEECFFDYLNKFSVPIDKKFKEFSRGMKMKLSIAVQLSHSAKLLILDEATSGLDPMVRNEILDIFNDFTRDENNAILISSHIISDLEKICDYITFIKDGKLVLSEEKDYLIDSYGIIKVSENQIADLPDEAIVRMRKTSYGYDVLALKERVNSSFKFEHTNLEDIVLFMAMEVKK